jgi:hypothetical protein
VNINRSSEDGDGHLKYINPIGALVNIFLKIQPSKNCRNSPAKLDHNISIAASKTGATAKI